MSNFQNCPKCNGEGKVDNYSMGDPRLYDVCPVCNGLRIIDSETGYPPRLITHADHGQPVGLHITVSDIIEEQKTESGMLISGESLKDMRYTKAKILRVGTDVTKVVDGDVILYDKANAVTQSVERVSTTFIQLRDVVMVI